MTITLTDISPPSVNQYWVRTKFGMCKSRRANAFIRTLHLLAFSKGMRPLDGYVSLGIIWTPVAQRGDIDNILKGILDALQGVAYHDDKQVNRLLVERREPQKHGKLQITVESYVA